MELTEIHGFTREQLKAQRDRKFAVMFPNGMVKEIPCGVKSVHAIGGDVPLKLFEGQPTIPKRYLEKGFRFYQDVCEQDGEPEKWDLWCEMLEERAKGRNVSFPIECFSKTVQALRGRTLRGGNDVDVDFAKRLAERESRPLEQRVDGELGEIVAGAGEDA